MEEKLKSEGKCLYCDQVYSQKEIGKHLAKHLAEMEKSGIGIAAQTYCHIVVDANEMFLHLLVKGDATMKVIDSFFKDIWLECCGHMSCFGHKYFKISMSHKVVDVFASGVKIYHDYDFGTTTRVFLKGLKNYQLNLKEKIILLSRNEPLKIMCALCKNEPAEVICPICIYEEYAFFCSTCSEIHEKECSDFGEDTQLPVVNSPRMGACGYEGGVIDTERDGVYKK